MLTGPNRSLSGKSEMNIWTFAADVARQVTAKDTTPKEITDETIHYNDLLLQRIACMDTSVSLIPTHA